MNNELFTKSLWLVEDVSQSRHGLQTSERIGNTEITLLYFMYGEILSQVFSNSFFPYI